MAITKTIDGKPLDFIHTFTGKKFRPMDPTAEDIDIRDIAHSLAMQPRFAGMTSRFYSVAEHSVRVSQACAERDAMWGILHDASEAYIKDIPAPVKYSAAFEPYREAEGLLQQAIVARFGLSPITEPSSVKRADLVLVHTEGRDLFPTGAHVTWLDERMAQPRRLSPLGWEAAERWFLERYYALERKAKREAAA